MRTMPWSGPARPDLARPDRERRIRPVRRRRTRIYRMTASCARRLGRFRRRLAGLASSLHGLRPVLALWSLPLAAGLARAGETPPPAPDYDRDVRPILASQCFKCHGKDESHRMAGLRLDRRDGA